MAMQSNMRSLYTNAPDAVWNYAVWKFQASYAETNGNENLVVIDNEVRANEDRYPSSETEDHVVGYRYVVEYGPSGDVQKTSFLNDWIGVSGQAVWAPQNLLLITNVVWGATNDVTEANLRTLDLNN